MAVDDDWEEMAMSQLSFEMPPCQDMSLEQRSWTEASQLLSAGRQSWKSGCEEKTLCVLQYRDIWSA
jgi:hypothetical protein